MSEPETIEEKMEELLANETPVENIEEPVENTEEPVENTEEPVEKPKSLREELFEKAAEEEIKNRTEPKSEEPKVDYAKKAKEDLFGLLSELGVTEEDISKAIVNTPDPQQQKMSELDQRLAKLDEAEKSRQQRDLQNQVNKYIEDLNTHINEGDYNLIKATNSQNAVLGVIEQYYEQTGKELEWDKACALIEEELLEPELEKVKSLLKIDSFREKLGLDELPDNEPKPKSKTLSVKNTSGSSNKIAQSEPKTIEEALKIAIKQEQEAKKNGVFKIT